MQETLINIGLYLTYVMIAIAVLAAVVFPLINLIQDPKSAKNSLIGIAGLGVIFLISYFISSNEVYQEAKITATVSKLIGGSMIMLYIMLAVSIIAAIYAEISRIFK